MNRSAIDVLAPCLSACGLLLLACTPSPSDQPICERGATQRCDCPGGLSGAQSCRDDGKGWLACQCLPEGSCASDADCDGLRRCDQETNSCVCLPRHHACQELCLPDDDVESCGQRCQPCPGSDHGQRRCLGGQCDILCDDGWHLCQGVCLSDAAPESCGQRCTPCPAPSYGQAICVEARCTVQCDAGYHPCGQGCCPWQVETVDPHAGAGAYADLAVQTDGTLLAVSYDLQDQVLRLARETGAGFSLEPVDASVDRGRYVRLALDSAEHAELVYQDARSLDLRFSSLVSGVWRHEVIASEGSPGVWLAFVVDRSTRHLSYVESSAAQLWYARDEGAGFVTQPVASGHPVDTQTALAVSDDGRVLIAFRDRNSRALMLSTLQQGVWSTETVDDSGDAGSYVSLQLDGNQRAVVAYSYFIPPRVELRLARFDGVAFDLDVIDGSGEAGLAPSLAIHGGVLHISYYDSVHDDLLYTRSLGPGQGWEKLRVVTSGDAGLFSAIKIGSAGLPVIAFSAQGLRIARW